MNLPAFSSKVMHLNVNKEVPFLTYDVLSEIPFITHAFSTRLGGVSKGEFSTMNFAFNLGDNPDDVLENYRRFCKAVGLDFDTLVASSQDHHTFVRKVTHENYGIGITRPKDIQSVDALVTDEPDVTLVTYYADCTPLFFVDTARKVIALAHGGWRGTVGCIAEKVIDTMKHDYGCQAENIICCIGPAISRCCYEVDKSCYEQFVGMENICIEKIAFPTENDKYRIDLLETNRQVILSCGVPEENITVSDICTKCNSELLWSHRATKGHRGTMCAFLCMKG